MKFIDRLNQTAEETAKTNNQLIADEKHLDFQKEASTCKQQIAAQTQAIEELKSSRTFTAKALYQAENKLHLMRRELVYYEELIKELF